MHSGQVFVLVAQVILTELTSSIAKWLEQAGNRGIFLLHADVGPRQAHLAEPGAEHALAHDKGRPTRSAALLCVVVGKKHTVFGDAVDVGRAVAHNAL